MRSPVAVLSLSLLVALLLPPAAQAQMSFDQAYQLRVGAGDIPTTAAHEPAGWSTEQRYTYQRTAAGATDSPQLHIPAGATVFSATCSCANATTDQTATTVTWHVPAGTPPGSVTLTLSTTAPRTDALALNLQTQGPSAVAIVYVPAGARADGPSTPSSPGMSTDGTSTIEVFSNLPSAFWITVAPGTVQVTPETPASPAGTNPWLFAAGGLVVGAIAWSVLVSRGMVQRRSRKQVATTAAHVEAAQAESPAVLEGRKRALMAALKEVELARQADEMDVPTYDVLKAELKKEAVTVMRAIDESGAKK